MGNFKRKMREEGVCRFYPQICSGEIGTDLFICQMADGEMADKLRHFKIRVEKDLESSVRQSSFIRGIS